MRFVKGDKSPAPSRRLRTALSPAPEDQVVPLSPQMVGLRFQAAARAAGVEPVTAHSGRVGLASGADEPGRVATAIIAARAEEEHPRETAETWSAVENLLQQQQQTRRAHESARAAARELRDRARSRESHQPPTQPNRIQRLAGWLLNCAHRVLEHLGMKPQQVLEERPTPVPGRPHRRRVQPEAGGQPSEVNGVGRREPPPAAQPAATERPRRQESPERLAAMEKELRRRAECCHDEDTVRWVLYDATCDITGEMSDWKTTSLEDQTRILDRADLLSMSGWMVGRALWVALPITPAQETIRAAAQKIADDRKLNGWQRRLAAGVASGEVRTRHDRNASVADEKQKTTDHLMKAKREAAADEAGRQTAAAIKEWNAKKWFRGPEPKPVDPAEPDPPTPGEIRYFRQEVFRTIKEAMQKDILEKFSEPIRDVVDRAFELGELPVSRSSPPRTHTRGPDPGRTM